ACQSVATAAAAARHQSRAELGFCWKDRLVGRRLVGWSRGERLSKWQDHSAAKLVRCRIATSLSFLPIHGLSESVRGLGIADCGELGAREVLRRLQPHIHPGSRWKPYRLFRSRE